ncbi:dynamin family protein [Cellulomonas aerilata]|uniref:GTPase n=1 Tax=Cellulomonas aerilata TaxID=515326 RepID=A0A512DD79_9CELL|nr:dynamin family protein [Cellulomonas aerilata]GEO34428.1 GTPase [Cellulomonas aerilata]
MTRTSGATATSGIPAPSGADEARRLLLAAVDVYAADPEARAVLEHALDRLDAPLQVALAGKLKAGKSTLLNALMGVELAASDHAECTRVVTWYRFADSAAVTVHPVLGEPWSSPPRRGTHGLEIDLRGRTAEEVDHVEVRWPAPGLRGLTLIDTPGLDSLSRDVSRRTSHFLTAEGEESDVDAVVYLMRHLHATDVRFLESFQHVRSARGATPGTVAVLSRADEVGVGRIDAMISAGRVAERYRADAALRPLCQTVLPVDGLLAQTGQTLREDELADLRSLAALDRSVTDGLLLSVDRFRRPSLSLPVAAPARAQLLARFGLFGVRLTLALLRTKELRAAALSEELVRRSGLAELRRVLDAQLTERRDHLRASAAVAALARVVADHPVPGSPELAAECERLTLAAQGTHELELLAALRAADIDLSAADVEAAERLLGASGLDPVDRLGLRPGARTSDVEAAAVLALTRWQDHAEDPLLNRDTRHACRLLARTCEALLSGVRSTGAVPAATGANAPVAAGQVSAAPAPA